MKTGKTKIGLFLFSSFLGSLLWAEPSINAKVSATQVSLNDSVTLSLEIAGVQNIRPPWPLNIPNFQVQRGGQTQSYQWVNGKSSSLLTFNYVLTPTKVGVLQIPSLTLTANNKAYSTKPINMTVAQARAPVPQAQPKAQAQARSSGSPIQVPSEGLKPVFMAAKVSKSRAYVGEQIQLTIQFLRQPGVRLASQPRYSEPDMTGFLVEPLKQKEYSTTIQGAKYLVTELRYALFPTSDGDFAIGNAQIDLGLRVQHDPFNPNSFFESFFGRSKTVRLNTRAIPIRVRALPQNKPTGFTGAVGRYKLTAKVDNSEPEVGKPFNLILKLDGVGNIASIKEPPLSELATFRKYETIANTKIDKEGDFLLGSKEFKTLLIPKVSGTLKIPSISFSYFNPDLRQYVTEKTKEIALQVQAGTLSEADQEPGLMTPAGQRAEGVQVVEKDIRFLKTGTLEKLSPPLYTRGAFLVANALPPIFAFAAAMVLVRSRRRSLYAAHYRSRGALGKALKTLKTASKYLKDGDPSPFYSVLTSALNGYLSDKLGVAVTGLIWEELKNRLMEAHVEADVADQVHEILEEADMARFASSSFTDDVREESLKKTKTILTQLDKQIQ